MAAANNVAPTPSMPTIGERIPSLLICLDGRFDISALDGSKQDRVIVLSLVSVAFRPLR